MTCEFGDIDDFKNLDHITQNVMMEEYADNLREEGYSEFEINQMMHAIEFELFD